MQPKSVARNAAGRTPRHAPKAVSAPRRPAAIITVSALSPDSVNKTRNKVPTKAKMVETIPSLTLSEKKPSAPLLSWCKGRRRAGAGGDEFKRKAFGFQWVSSSFGVSGASSGSFAMLSSSLLLGGHVSHARKASKRRKTPETASGIQPNGLGKSHPLSTPSGTAATTQMWMERPKTAPSSTKG